VGEVTRLSGQLAQTEDARADLEEKLREFQDAAARQEELLRGDLAGLTTQLDEARARLAEANAERAREREAATRDAQARGEQLKQGEARFKEFTEAAGRRRDRALAEASVATRETRTLKTELGGRVDQLSAQLAQARSSATRHAPSSGPSRILRTRTAELEAELSSERAGRRAGSRRCWSAPRAAETAGGGDTGPARRAGGGA
jgi:HK97 family phage major capsid protein